MIVVLSKEVVIASNWLRRIVRHTMTKTSWLGANHLSQATLFCIVGARQGYAVSETFFCAEKSSDASYVSPWRIATGGVKS